MSSQKTLRKLLRLFLLAVVLVFGHTLVEFSQNPEKVVSRMIKFLRGEIPTYVPREEDKPEVKQWDPQFYGPIRETPRAFDYRRLSSLSSQNGSFWPVNLGRLPGYNANLIPHPTNTDSWIVVAQREQYYEEFEYSEELACEASFTKEALKCRQDAKELPIARSVFGLCDFALFNANFRRGPRDARVFYGPEAAYIMYGSQSRYICMGLWIQDIRTMLDEFRRGRDIKIHTFKTATELQRINTTGPIEKNYFLFWDSNGKGYVHYNLWPERSFAELHDDGSEANELSRETAESDQKCIRNLMPPVAQEVESIHQATNSLSVTMCKRSEPGCVQTDTNTFIMHIFHHKGFYGFHGVYEPFIVLFKRNAPFDLHAISQKPFWVEGRKDLTSATDATKYRKQPESIPENHTEFFYITSMSWKMHGQKYHGFIDDELFVSFGIEDARSGTIDVRAGDLLQDLAYCDKPETWPLRTSVSLT